MTKLDISWIDSPFIYHHILIKSQKHIDKLVKSGVKLLTIDTEKGLDVLTSEPTTGAERAEAQESHLVSTASDDHYSDPENNQTDSPATLEAGINEPVKVERVSLNVEMSVAKDLMSKMTSMIKEINDSFNSGDIINAELLEPFIDDTLASLKRNEHALTALVNMQRKDESLAKHAFATFSLVLSLSIKLGLSNQEKESLGLAAFFHDVGWLKLPLNLLGKSIPYTENEKKLVHRHVDVGLKTLAKQCDLPDLVLRIVSEHHETLDGNGYPLQLTNENIHSMSKLFSVVVRYDELVHGLIDSPALTPNGALGVLFKESKQGKLDPVYVSSLISLLSVYPVGSCVQLSNKEKALVVETQADHPKQPKVKVFYDIAGLAHLQPKELNLANQASHSALEIVAVLDLSNPTVDPAKVMAAYNGI